MNRIQAVLKMHFRDKWSWFHLPWLILFSSFAVNLIISFFVKDPVYTGGLSSIYVYMFVAGILSLAQTFPFALSFSLRRTDFFLGTAVMILAAGAVMAFLLLLLSIIENSLGGWGTDLHFFHLPYLNDGTVIEQFLIYFIVMLYVYSFGFVICSVFRRFGGKGMFVLFISLIVIFTVLGFVANQNQWWGPIFRWISGQTAFELSLWMVPAVAVYGLLSYLMLRKATV